LTQKLDVDVRLIGASFVHRPETFLLPCFDAFQVPIPAFVREIETLWYQPALVKILKMIVLGRWYGSVAAFPQ
jgi:hypothetical protein